jgi:hypothetical protein
MRGFGVAYFLSLGHFVGGEGLFSFDVGALSKLHG